MPLLDACRVKPYTTRSSQQPAEYNAREVIYNIFIYISKKETCDRTRVWLKTIL